MKKKHVKGRVGADFLFTNSNKLCRLNKIQNKWSLKSYLVGCSALSKFSGLDIGKSSWNSKRNS